MNGQPTSAPPRTTAIGALAYYVSHADPAHYEPSNITFGIMEPLARAAARQDGAEAGDVGARAGRSGRMDGSRAAPDGAWGAVIDHLKALPPVSAPESQRVARTPCAPTKAT